MRIEQDVWQEYDAAAEWCAKRGIKGNEGDALPSLLSAACFLEIDKDSEAFQRRIRETAYGLAMSRIAD